MLNLARQQQAGSVNLDECILKMMDGAQLGGANAGRGGKGEEGGQLSPQQRRHKYQQPARISPQAAMVLSDGVVTDLDGLQEVTESLRSAAIELYALQMGTQCITQ